MPTHILDIDHFSIVVIMFLPPPFRGAMSYVALILKMNGIFTRLSFIFYRMNISGICLVMTVFFFYIAFV